MTVHVWHQISCNGCGKRLGQGETAVEAAAQMAIDGGVNYHGTHYCRACKVKYHIPQCLEYEREADEAAKAAGL